MKRSSYLWVITGKIFLVLFLFYLFVQNPTYAYQIFWKSEGIRDESIIGTYIFDFNGDDIKDLVHVTTIGSSQPPSTLQAKFRVYDGNDLDKKIYNKRIYLYPTTPYTFDIIEILDVDNDGQDEMIFLYTNNADKVQVRIYDPMSYDSTKNILILSTTIRSRRYDSNTNRVEYRAIYKTPSGNPGAGLKVHHDFNNDGGDDMILHERISTRELSSPTFSNVHRLLIIVE